MKWTEKKLQELPLQNDFRLRGLQTTRLETFTDAAFAFAITMLVISVGNIPHTYDELVTALKAAPSFLACFSVIMLFWAGHRKWSRRFGLEDKKAMLYSFALIFVMLVYVYPLRLMFSALFSWISAGWLPSEFIINDVSQMLGLFAIYGIGFSAMSISMALLYKHVLSIGPELLLSDLELLIIKLELKIWLILASAGFLSAVVALVFPTSIAVWAGFVYTTLPITMPIIARRSAKKIALFKSEQS
jgi:uncharacterized membrane protein